MTSVDTIESVDEQAIVREIRFHGEKLWSGRLPKEYAGKYVLLNDPDSPQWSLLYRCNRIADGVQDWYQELVRFFGLVVLGPIDLLQILLRLILLPIMKVLWLLECGVGKLLRRSYFCPTCHNSMSEPFVYCRACNRVQGTLYPQFGSLFFKTCPGCVTLGRKKKSRWRTLGNVLFSTPGPLVCRDTRSSTGCYRPHLMPSVAGKYVTKHIVVTGVAIRTKHSILAHMIQHATSGQAKPCYRAEGKVSELELKLARSRLWKSLYENTSAYEQFGKRYTLARSLVLKGNKRVLAFHNLCHAWIGNEDRLFTNGVSWTHATSIVFVVDLYLLRNGVNEALISHVELFSRIIRVIEKDYPLLPGTRLPLKVVVVLPVAESDELRRSTDSFGALDPHTVASIIAKDAPEFYALCCRSVVPRNLHFIGGVLPTGDHSMASRWTSAIVTWVS